MKRNAATRVSVRLATAGASLLAGLALAVSPVWAGDRALLEVIGYSSDSHYFAFEEFGIQDGSGFAYSNIYVVDLTEDNWVVGTPVRKQADDEKTPLTAVRADAVEKAGDILATLGIEAPAQVLAMVGDGAPDQTGETLRFGLPRYSDGTVDGDYLLSLKTAEAQAMTPCSAWFGAQALGFTLSVEDKGAVREVHADETLPRSRGCPVSYRIHAVLAPWTDDPLPHAVALISVFAHGFEGPDRRFVAVPLAF